MTEYVVTLSPDEESTTAIERLKSYVRSMVGPQQYLDDEPHVTLYVGELSVDPASEVEFPPLEQVAFEVTGWEVFRDDTVTGNHTLACRLEGVGLGDYQRRVAATLAPYRNQPMIERFEDAYADLDEQRQENLEEYGYPFIGTGWIPHLTIASIDPGDFETVWTELEDEAPVGEFEFESLAVYELTDNNLGERTELPL